MDMFNRTRNTLSLITKVLLATVLLMPSFASAELDLNILKATPVGSWSVREETTTDHRGRQTVSVMRSSMLGSEERNGQKYYWIEMVADSFKLKKGKRKKNGDRVIMKTLISEEVFSGDPANAVQNLRGIGEEMIVQNGNSQPMRMSGAGGFAKGMLKGMGTEINFDFKSLGNADVSVPAGNFSTQKMQGTGSTSMKMMFKKITVTSDATSYYSEKVPFGIVKVEGESTINGKPSTNQVLLLEYGTSGATSQITGTPQEMPEMPNMKDLFGGGKG